jgi:UDP-glucose 4-epimerase
MNILVTGGAGYIGSHATRYLLDRGHKVVVLDNLSQGHREAIDFRATVKQISIQNIESVIGVLKSYHIEAVLHFAGYIEVAESVKHPAKYYENNVAGTLALLEALREAQVKKIVFSSTAAVYGNPVEIPITENHPCNPVNPYGRTKFMSESMIQDYCAAYGLGYAILRYFNVAGASPDGLIGEAHHPETHLIPRILQSLLFQNEKLKIFGNDYNTKDGTCVRDYIHVMDLVTAHLLAVENLVEGRGDIFNLGSENGFTVTEVIAACEKVTQQKIPYEIHDRRAGDPAILVASSEKIRQTLNWKRQFPDLTDMIAHAWQWHSRYPYGYSFRNVVDVTSGYSGRPQQTL